MAEKLKIISLGGLNEIGKNLTVYEYGNDIIVVDCGMGFPDDDMYGIDVVIPDVSYLIKNQSKIRGIFITHGHEDHIGAIPYVLRSVNAPIYATRMSAGLIQLKLEEHRLVSKTKMITCEAGDVIQAGKFSVEFIHVNHSIADAVAFAIKSPVGTVVHTGDFKIDTTPIQGGMIDLARFGALGREGVLALLADSTNVERPGYTMSERTVGETFMNLFEKADGAERTAPRPLRPRVSKEAERLYRAFEREFFLSPFAETLHEAGGLLYALPEDTFDFSLLRVLRAGVRLGEVKNGRFEPSHSLAMCAERAECRNVLELCLSDVRVGRFLRGESVETDEKLKNGFCLVCVGGYPVGYGKAVNGTVKNHIPKALRRMSA